MFSIILMMSVSSTPIQVQANGTGCTGVKSVATYSTGCVGGTRTFATPVRSFLAHRPTPVRNLLGLLLAPRQATGCTGGVMTSRTVTTYRGPVQVVPAAKPEKPKAVEKKPAQAPKAKP